MIFKSDELKKSVVEKPRGGSGKMNCSFAFRMEEAPEGSAFQLAGSLNLEPGSELGYHQHADNEELYVILSGHGIFIDENKAEMQVGPGDMLLTRKGESHGLANTGDEPLHFLAVVAKN